jgi:hypothetical protein
LVQQFKEKKLVVGRPFPMFLANFLPLIIWDKLTLCQMKYHNSGKSSLRACTRQIDTKRKDAMQFECPEGAG